MMAANSFLEKARRAREWRSLLPRYPGYLTTEYVGSTNANVRRSAYGGAFWLTFPLSCIRDLRGEARQTGPHRRGARIQLIRRQGGARAIELPPVAYIEAMKAADILRATYALAPYSLGVPLPPRTGRASHGCGRKNANCDRRHWARAQFLLVVAEGVQARIASQRPETSADAASSSLGQLAQPPV